MDGYEKIANEFCKRNNKIIIGICVAEVIGLTPVTLQIFYAGEPIIFTEFFNIKGIINGNEDKTTGDLYVEDYPVEIGDRFICTTGNDNNSLYVLGRFESIKDLNIYKR